MICVLRPTRGIEFSESAESIERALEGYERTILRTWYLPIPDSFNTLIGLALKTSAQEFFFVEEDVVIPANALSLLRSLDVDVAAINYRNKIEPSCISEQRLKGAKDPLWVSLGCTLIRRKVFERLPAPWFVIGKAVAIKHPGRKTRLVDSSPDRTYGNHDQVFCYLAKQAGFSIGSVDGILCRHLRLDRLGNPGTNKGLHKISSF